jgi:hypothetical protein
MLSFIPPLYGFVLAGVGLTAFTIGGLIQMAQNPRKLDEDRRWIDEQFKKNPWGMYSTGVEILDPKIRWWCVPGLMAFFVDLAILIFR